MTEMSEEAWAELAEEIKKAKRPHAGHFSWETDKSIAEKGVLGQFVDELKADGCDFFNDWRHRSAGNDPPDCEAALYTGGRAGIEITELVHQASAAAARAGKSPDWHDWREELIPKLSKMIQKKDGAVIKGGPYTEYILLIHSDEPWLEIDRIRLDVSKHVFSAPNLITRAYFFMSYAPSTGRYPYFRLSIEGKHIK